MDQFFCMYVNRVFLIALKDERKLRQCPSVFKDPRSYKTLTDDNNLFGSQSYLIQCCATTFHKATVVELQINDEKY